MLAIDEKPSIQALERAQGYLKLPNGRAITGQSHDYKRNGTTTLFAALDLKSGKVVGRHYKRRRRVEFLDFMNKVVAAHPDREIHVVLDNLSTHKPKRDMWLKRHKNVHFHFTPTHASWLNQVEIWFSILAAQSLDGASFQSVPELIAHIEAFITDYNETPGIVWTKSQVTKSAQMFAIMILGDLASRVRSVQITRHALARSPRRDQQIDRGQDEQGEQRADR